MSMELTEDTLGIWYVQLQDDADWLLTLSEVEDSYKIVYRFRYYEDDRNFESDDRKSWYEAEVSKKDEKDPLKLVREMADAIHIMRGLEDTEITELLVEDRNINAFMEKFQELPFVHMQKEEVH